MKSGRWTDLLKASAVHKDVFLDFFNLCVGEVNFLWRVAVVAGIRHAHLTLRSPA